MHRLAEYYHFHAYQLIGEKKNPIHLYLNLLVPSLQHLQLLVACLECAGFFKNGGIFCKLLLKPRDDTINFLYLLLKEHRG